MSLNLADHLLERLPAPTQQEVEQIIENSNFYPNENTKIPKANKNLDEKPHALKTVGFNTPAQDF